MVISVLKTKRRSRRGKTVTNGIASQTNAKRPSQIYVSVVKKRKRCYAIFIFLI